MKHPRVIVLESDGWLAKQLRELAAENRCLVRSVRTNDAALSLVKEQSPAVLLVQFEPAEDRPQPLSLLADVHRLVPDVPIVAVADSKLSDAERAAWTAALLDLGARYVLFPPLTKPVLEDIVSGLLTAAIRRVLGEEWKPPPPSRPSTRDEVIDLADEDTA
jgi:DNA-binding response OmpR family regulator